MKKKVLVVDDSAFMRKMISDFLSEDDRLEVIGTARNGKDAIEKVKELKPDCVTLDIEMPIMNGLDALQTIMKTQPVPVVMLSSLTKEGADHTLLAIQYGAVDFLLKPSGSISLDLHKIKQEMIEKVVQASRVNINMLKPPITEKDFFPNVQNGKESSEQIVDYMTLKQPLKKLVLIGTSTGGPRALQHVLEKIPITIQAPILIVQHMPPGFTKSLAERLNQLSKIEVKEAIDGEILKNGTAYIAPGGSHLKIKRSAKSLIAHVDSTSPPKNNHRPSVDVMFESAENLTDYAKVAVILTGMGSDGSDGLKKLKKSGNVKIIAESKESSIIFGMPKAAINTGLVDEVAHIHDIASTIMKYL